MNRHTSVIDRTATRPAASPGMEISQLWMCGHRARSGKYRAVPGLRGIAWRCMACVEAAKAAKVAA